MSSYGEAARITFGSLRKMKAEGRKIASLTAYDAAFARLLDGAGIDMILVGDTLGVVVQGRDTTIPVGVAEMVYHCSCVTRVARRPLILCDMPFMSYYNVDRALENATLLIQKGGAHGIKLEAGKHQVEIVRELSTRGIPCCAHLGLRPQWLHKMGRYRVQAKDPASAQRLLDEARALEEAGADLLLLECIPADVAEAVTGAAEIPVIGIGAGSGCDGQILVLHDVLGIGEPGLRFAENFLQGRDSIKSAISAYIDAVRSGAFPDSRHTYS